MRGLAVPDLEKLLGQLQVVSETRLTCNAGNCYLNFGSSEDAQTAARLLHNYPSPTDASGCLWAKVKSPAVQAHHHGSHLQGTLKHLQLEVDNSMCSAC